MQRWQTDTHFLEFFDFLSWAFFFGRNIDLRGSFPTHDLKFGQFCDSTKSFGLPKFCWNFSEIFRFFFEQFWKNIIFRDHFSRKILLNDYDFWQFSTHPWYMRVCGKLRKLKKMSFKGLEKCPRNIFIICPCDNKHVCHYILIESL